MKKINVAISIIILIMWCIGNEYLHVSNTIMDIQMQMVGVVEMIRVNANILFEISIIFFAFISIFSAIWLCFGEDIEKLIEKLIEMMKNDRKTDKNP